MPSVRVGRYQLVCHARGLNFGSICFRNLIVQDLVGGDDSLYFHSRQDLDNEISKAYRTEVQATGMTYQLVPPDDHRRNVAEKAIQTWKDHFVGVLSGTSDTFPLHLWCQVLPQMERQLLLLRQSNTNPKISAYAHVYGQHNYNAAPSMPMGTNGAES